VVDVSDIVVIGGGIAGIGMASEIENARVTVLEREPSPGTHATGRSAAMLLLNYGNAAIRALTAAGQDFYRGPDPEYWPAPLLAPRGELFLARPGEEAMMEAHLASAPHLAVLSPAEAGVLVPILRAETIASAAHDPVAADIDVDLLLQGYLRRLRRRGGRIETGAEVIAVARKGSGWRVDTTRGSHMAGIVVNAAGAWADAVARLAGLPPLGLQPLRRSAVILPPPEDRDVARWPLFGTLAEDWYAKPSGGRLMVSPADEDPVGPHDAWADDMVLAEGLARYEAMVTVPVTRVERSWAGLRTFAPDRSPVLGFDQHADGFFWLAGQGGYGIQTAPALSRLAAAMVAGGATAADADLARALSPARFGRPTALA
jgi:D-arginine dehydrogenase